MYINVFLSSQLRHVYHYFLSIQLRHAYHFFLSIQLGHVYQCTGCEALHFQRLGKMSPHDNGKNMKYSLVTGSPVDRSCEHCSSPFHMGGPIWLNPIQDKQFINELLDSIEENKYATERRITGMLTMALEELEDVPLYYEIPRLTNIVKKSQEKLTKYTSAILNAGYQFSLSHANRSGLKTTAPLSFLWDMLRTQAKEEGREPTKNLHPDSPGYKIMSKEATAKVDFTLHPEANPESREKNLKRFQINPEANWGPKARARTSFIPEGSEKQVKNQDKKRKRDERKDEKFKKLKEKEEECDQQL